MEVAKQTVMVGDMIARSIVGNMIHYDSTFLVYDQHGFKTQVKGMVRIPVSHLMDSEAACSDI